LQGKEKEGGFVIGRGSAACNQETVFPKKTWRCRKKEIGFSGRIGRRKGKKKGIPSPMKKRQIILRCHLRKEPAKKRHIRQRKRGCSAGPARNESSRQAVCVRFEETLLFGGKLTRKRDRFFYVLGGDHLSKEKKGGWSPGESSRGSRYL